MYLMFLEDFNDQHIFLNSAILLLGMLCISVPPYIAVLSFQALLPGLILYLATESEL